MLEHKPELRSALLFTLTLELGPIHNIGMTPNGHRRIVEVKSGRFEGEELSGIVLPAVDTIATLPLDAAAIQKGYEG